MSSDLAPKTVRTNVGVLRAVMSAAVDAGLLPLNPCPRVRLPAENRSAPRFLSVGELQRLAEAMPIEYRTMVYVGGRAQSPVVGGGRPPPRPDRPRALHPAGRGDGGGVEGRLSVEDVKTRTSRATLPVPPRVAEVLASHVARSGRSRPEDLVFQSPDGGPVRAANFRLRVWSSAVEAAGLVGLTFHGLRHSAAGLMIELGAHPR
jgi:integrase